MKYFVLLCIGASDRKISSLGGKTPFEAAVKPTFNMLSYRSFNGIVSNAAEKYPADPVAAFLSVINNDPNELTGYAAFDAISDGINLDSDDTVYKCSFITLSDNGEEYKDKVIEGIDGGISKEDASKLISALNKGLSTKIKKFYAKENINCLVWKRAPENAVLCDPDKALHKKADEYLPSGDGGAKLTSLFEKSFQILNDHPVNVKRRERGEKPLNSIWLWSASKKPELTYFPERWQVTPSFITDRADLKVISELAGMKYINASENNTENAALIKNEFENGADLVLFCTDKAAERSLEGDTEGKVKVIEDIDANVLAPVYEYLCGCGDQFKLIVTTGISALTEEKAYCDDSVPFFMYNSQRSETGYKPFSENNAKKSGFYLPDGYKFTSFMIRLPEPVKEETQQEDGQQQ